MGLVDYSDSESEGEAPVPPKSKPQPSSAAVSTSKKPFQKIVDRSHPGKILVNLPQAAAAGDEPSEGPAPKRIKTGGGRFSGFSSFLPPPKTTNKPAAAPISSSGNKAPPRIGVHLKTSAEAAFSRDSPVGLGDGEEDGPGTGLNLPPPKSQAPQPSIPAELKPEEEVKLVGKPLMFKPLSVARKPGKKSGTKSATAAKVTTSAASATSSAAPSRPAAASTTEEPPKKKVSLFSIDDEPAAPEEEDEPEALTETETYSSLYESSYTAYAPTGGPLDSPSFADQQYQQPQTQANHSDPQSLTAIADDLGLSAAARRELFGRAGAPAAGQQAGRVVNFNMDREYAHNEQLRASGEVQQFNPVRAIQPGKHSLRQLANAVQSQREALEESFAQNKGKKSEAAGRYGWR
ncbi:Mitotic checkpoint regulator, MAD2B-interacting-domain-containing protein [Pleurostoma richardsiae]|uniref:Mitotic checkpoint regulator, MAD2B-interacting-domain-containing protein n=1 Tax=Pleurostoma richardsiae TaxID=41990 RepID=A0AA38VJU1_9PEZI|nr:Mitotic checkpoint regulator, MAD2B-interacting-domain-containing protein [Pleurostoma richardsiae]